jgi:hypothetical protein
MWREAMRIWSSAALRVAAIPADDPPGVESPVRRDLAVVLHASLSRSSLEDPALASARRSP